MTKSRERVTMLLITLCEMKNGTLFNLNKHTHSVFVSLSLWVKILFINKSKYIQVYHQN